MALRYDFEELGPAHRAVLSLVPRGSEVVELGCATGYMTRVLAQKGCRVTAVDVDAQALDRLGAEATRRLVLDLDREQLPADVVADVAVCADVLEHLRDPVAVLRQLARIVGEHGRVVVSVPNVAFWRVRWRLLLGRFDYEETGILDRTHVGFYTLSSARALAERGGFEVREIRGISESFPAAWLLRTPLRPLKHKLDGLAHRLFPRLFAYQWVMLLQPSDPG